MSDVFVEPGRPKPPAFGRGGAVVAWLVVAGVVAAMLLRNHGVPRGTRAGLDLVTVRLQARYFVGLSHLNLPGLASHTLYEQAAKAIDRGPYAQRLRFVPVAGELGGPNKALQHLDELAGLVTEGAVEPTAEEQRLADLLERLYENVQQANAPAAGRSGPVPPLTAEQQMELRDGLDWFGDLALAAGGDPAEQARAMEPARRTTVAMLVWVGVILCLGVGGLVLLLGLAVLAFSGHLKGGLTVGATPGGVYAETFALYLLLFLGLSYAVAWIPIGHSRLLLAGAAAVGSLAALAWPVLRGVPWRQVCADIGWYGPSRPGLGLLAGIGTYAAALPLALVGVLIMFALKSAQDQLGWGVGPFDPGGGPVHPIFGAANEPGWWTWVQVLLVAAVAAPIVEETMFRGVLYRHLREATGGWGRVLSVLSSGLVVSFVFAVIHPQGLLAVPVLMGLAFAFALSREWRGTLLPPMLAHALNNGMATVLLLTAAS